MSKETERLEREIEFAEKRQLHGEGMICLKARLDERKKCEQEFLEKIEKLKIKWTEKSIIIYHKDIEGKLIITNGWLIKDLEELKKEIKK